MEEISVLIARSQSGDKKAREVLIEKNLGLVHSIVRRFAGRGYDLEDLFQIGTIGLMKSIDKFDLGLELQFSTYAVPMITGEIRRFLRDDGPVKVSRTIKENSFKIRAARQKLQGSMGREPTIGELSRECGLSLEDVVLAMEASREVESIYASVNQEDGSEMFLVDRVIQGQAGQGGTHGGTVGVVAGIGHMDPEKEQLLNKVFLKELLDSLSDKDRRLISMRYFQNKTQTQVAEDMGISQVQVSRLEKKILLKMRQLAGNI